MFQSLTNSITGRVLLHDFTDLGKPALPEAPALKVQAPRGRDQLATDVGAPRRGRLLGPDAEQRLLPQLVPSMDDPLGRDAHAGVDTGLWERLALVILGGVALQAGAQLPDTEGAEGGLDFAEDAGDKGIEIEPLVKRQFARGRGLVNSLEGGTCGQAGSS